MDYVIIETHDQITESPILINDFVVDYINMI